jgi:hypothetical protein
MTREQRQAAYYDILSEIRQRLTILEHRLDEHGPRAASDNYGTAYIEDLDHILSKIDTIVNHYGTLILGSTTKDN